MLVCHRRHLYVPPECLTRLLFSLDWAKATIPPNPSYLRLLYLGRILQDDDTLESKSGTPPYCSAWANSTWLSELKLSTHIPKPDYDEGRDTPYATTIMHLSIRPVAPPADDGLPKKKGKRRLRSEGGVEEDETQSGCCSGCVIC